MFIRTGRPLMDTVFLCTLGRKLRFVRGAFRSQRPEWR